MPFGKFLFLFLFSCFPEALSCLTYKERTANMSYRYGKKAEKKQLKIGEDNMSI